MMDTSGRVKRIFQMIRKGDYFVIDRPRQYGKTTILYMLNRFLETGGEYFPIKISFEGIGSDSYKSEALFIEALMLQLKLLFRMSGNKDKELAAFVETGFELTSISRLGLWITDLVQHTGKPMVLMIDEVDKSCNNQLFLDFLGMLRNKYLKQREGADMTFASVILAGVHDVKTLKTKIPKGEEEKFNSPWNIAVDFDIDFSFSTTEIEAMLREYAVQRGIEIDTPYFAEKLFYYTSGYPFLVSYLCKIIDEKIIPGKEKKAWTREDLLHALHMALRKKSTNFQGVIKNLANNPGLHDMVFELVMNGNEFSYNPYNAVIKQGMQYGILREDLAKVRVHNRLYEQLIYDYMSSNLEISTGIGGSPVAPGYVRDDGPLKKNRNILPAGL